MSARSAELVRTASLEEQCITAREAFLGRFRLGCLCTPLESRIGAACPTCGAPLVRIVPDNVVTGT